MKLGSRGHSVLKLAAQVNYALSRLTHEISYKADCSFHTKKIKETDSLVKYMKRQNIANESLRKP